MTIPKTGNINFDRLPESTKVGLINQSQNQNSGILGGRGLAPEVINLALLLGGIKSLGAQPAGRNFADNLAEGVSQGIQLGAALQPKPPLVPPGETREQETLGEGSAKEIIKIKKDASQALEDINNYDRLIEIVSKIDEKDFGSFAQFRQSLVKFGKLVGVDTDAIKDTPSIEVLNQFANQIVLAGLSNFKGAISDGEREFLVDMSAGLGNSKEGNLKILETLKNIAQRKVLKSQATDLFRANAGNVFENLTVPTIDGKTKMVDLNAFSVDYIHSQIGTVQDFMKTLNIGQDLQISKNNFRRVVIEEGPSKGKVFYEYVPPVGSGIEPGSNFAKSENLSEEDYFRIYGE
tara:strand:+ start:67 stop:1113 length:1047 start_codon:yes stop_codon:yes gene_type:complete